MSSVEAVDNPQQGQNIFDQPLTIFGVPVDREKIFVNHKGIYKSRVEKRQRKLIVKSTFIKFFLHHGETIQCITTGYSPFTVMEQVATGPAFLYFRRALFVFTEKRILHVPARFNLSPRGAVSQILYEDCAGIQIKGRALHVRYKNGQQEIFAYMGRKEKKKLRGLIANLKRSPKEAGHLQGRAFLCPSCTHVLADDAAVCGACRLAFKSKFKTNLLSLLPGGGYFYIRHPFIGLAAALLELVLAGGLIFYGRAAYDGQVVPLPMLLLPALALVLEKLIMVYHTNRIVGDFIPEKKDYTIRKI